MKKIFILLFVIVLPITIYLYFSNNFKMTEDGFPIPKKAVLVDAKKIEDGSLTYTYQVNGWVQTDGLPSSYKKEFERLGWKYDSNQSMGADYFFKKGNKNSLRLSVFDNQIEINYKQ